MRRLFSLGILKREAYELRIILSKSVIAVKLRLRSLILGNRDTLIKIKRTDYRAKIVNVGYSVAVALGCRKE